MNPDNLENGGTSGGTSGGNEGGNSSSIRTAILDSAHKRGLHVQRQIQKGIERFSDVIVRKVKVMPKRKHHMEPQEIILQ